MLAGISSDSVSAVRIKTEEKACKASRFVGGHIRGSGLRNRYTAMPTANQTGIASA
jgi:hypothetical protein